MNEPSPLSRLWDDAVQQVVTRELLEAMARPGTIRLIPGHGHHVLLAVLATVVDQSVTLADPHQLLSARQRPFFGAATAPVADAAFVICDGQQWSEGLAPNRGELARPELGATVVIRVTSIEQADADRDDLVLTRAELSGPGIQGRTALACRGLDPRYLMARNTWCAEFPCGVDLFLVDATQCIAVPRSAAVHLTGVEVGT